ncbi:hypothetical protein, partial [uncultured Eubacterium sp.]|uniref:hypothetical protein n=1 Tax=uncultured Eubacterium sp. TaxID=165185 RepID=UPI0025F1E5DE
MKLRWKKCVALMGALCMTVSIVPAYAAAVPQNDAVTQVEDEGIAKNHLEGVWLDGIESRDNVTVPTSFSLKLQVSDCWSSMSEIRVNYVNTEKNDMGNTKSFYYHGAMDPVPEDGIYTVPIELTGSTDSGYYKLDSIAMSGYVNGKYYMNQYTVTSEGIKEENGVTGEISYIPYAGTVNFTVKGSTDDKQNMNAQIESVELIGADQKDSISAPCKLNARIYITNMTKEDNDSIIVCYKMGEKSLTFNRSLMESDWESISNNHYVDVPIELSDYSSVGEYTLDNIQIVHSMDWSIMYTNEDNYLWKDKNFGGTHSIKYDGELDFYVSEAANSGKIHTMLQNISLSDNTKKDNIETPDKLFANLSFECVWEDGINSVRLKYVNTKTGNERTFSSEGLMKDDGKNIQIPMYLNTHMEKGDYKLEQIAVEGGMNQQFFNYNAELKAFVAEDASLDYRQQVYSYDGECDFSITKADYENEVLTSIFSLEKVDNADWDNIEAPQTLQVKLGVKSGLEEGIKSVCFRYTKPGSDYVYDTMDIEVSCIENGKVWKPGDDGESITLNLPVSEFIKSGVYKLQYIELYPEKGRAIEYNYVESKNQFIQDDYFTGKSDAVDYTGELDFTVTKSSADTTDPELTYLKLNNGTKVTAGEKLEWSFGYDEDISGVQCILVSLSHEDSDELKDLYMEDQWEPKTCIGKGDAIATSNFSEIGDYTVDFVRVVDYAGNERNYWKHENGQFEDYEGNVLDLQTPTFSIVKADDAKKLADYTKVDAALKTIPSDKDLKDLYTEESVKAVTAA